MFCGIDPGNAGAIAIWEPVIDRLEIQAMPLEEDGSLSRRAVLGLCRSLKFKGAFVAIEKIHAFPRSRGGGVVNFSLGLTKGTWLTAFESQDVAYDEVPSSAWRKEFSLGVITEKKGRRSTQEEKDAAYKERKQKSLAFARERFRLPFKTPRGRDLDGHAEAAILALYGAKKSGYKI